MPLTYMHVIHAALNFERKPQVECYKKEFNMQLKEGLVLNTVEMHRPDTRETIS